MGINKGHYMGPLGDFIILYQQEDEEIIGFHAIRFNLRPRTIGKRDDSGVYINFLVTSPAIPRPRYFVEDLVLRGAFDE